MGYLQDEVVLGVVYARQGEVVAAERLGYMLEEAFGGIADDCGEEIVYATLGSVASSSVRDLVNVIVKEDEASRIRLAELWNTARTEKGIDEASLLAYVDQTAQLLDESQTLNFLRWKIMNEKIQQNPVIHGSYEAEVEAIKTYLKQRLPKMDYLIGK